MLHWVDPITPWKIMFNMCDYILIIRAVQRTRKHSTSQKCSGYERIENTAGLAETERDSSGIGTKSNG